MGLRRPMPSLFLPGLLLLTLACSAQRAESPSASPSPATSDVSESPTSSTVQAPSSRPPLATATPPPPGLALHTPTEPPPKLDTSVANVDLEDVVFDTFRGGYIPLDQASDQVIEALRDAIQPIYEPAYDPAERGDWLKETDLVMGYATRSGAYAYPIKILNFHEIVNDVIDGVPVLVSYCPLCFSGAVYSRDLEGEVLLFGNTSALYESDMVMYDHQTGSYWFQVIGEAIVGPLTGKRLELLPSMTTTWGEWKRQHPETVVLSRNIEGLGDPRQYERDPFVGYAEGINRGRFYFPVSKEKLDGRLRPGDKVFAVQVGESHKAYPLATDSDWVLNDEVGGESVVVIGRAERPAAVAYLRTINGRELSFRLNDGSVEDAETNSEWDDSGKAVSGPMAGAQLMAVPSRTSFWFSLVGALPSIELYQPQ